MPKVRRPGEEDGSAQNRVQPAEPVNGDQEQTEEKAKTRKVLPERRIVLPNLQLMKIDLEIAGTSELITHHWSEKAIRQILEKQTGAASAGRENKDPVEDFMSSLYVMEVGEVEGSFSLDPERQDEDGHPRVTIRGGRYGFPAIGFSKAAATACTSLKGKITKTAAKQAFQICGGELVEIHGQPRMRRDMVRLSGVGRPPDIRFRAGFKQWWANIEVEYNSRVMSAEQIANLIDTAGFAVGIGEWRPEKGGSYGRFRVVRR